MHAVLAMQGKISMETVKTAMPVFFAELLEDGQIDRAMAVARGKVREQPDSWMPALFLRLKGGRIWYEPGFGEGEGDFDKWKALVGAVRRRRASRRSSAPGWARASTDRCATPARELAERRGSRSPSTSAPSCSRSPSSCSSTRTSRPHASVQERAAAADPAETRARFSRRRKALEPLQAHGARGAAQPRADPDDPYGLLAQLDAKLFVTANPDNLLEEALRAEGQGSPRRFFFNWRKKAQAARRKTSDERRTETTPTPTDSPAGLPHLRLLQGRELAGAHRGRLLRLPDQPDPVQAADPGGRRRIRRRARRCSSSASSSRTGTSGCCTG